MFPRYVTVILKNIQALKKVFVNIFDLVDAVNGQRRIARKFKWRQPLSEYTRAENKVFPKHEAKDDPLLAHFLITL